MVPPKVKGYPLIGSFFDVIPYVQKHQFAQYLLAKKEQLGRIYKLKALNTNLIIVSDASAAKLNFSLCSALPFTNA
jgi:hypothetical protein